VSSTSTCLRRCSPLVWPLVCIQTRGKAKIAETN
jgi:hypothetical protein